MVSLSLGSGKVSLTCQAALERIVVKEEATRSKLSFDKVAKIGGSLPSSLSSDHSIAPQTSCSLRSQSAQFWRQMCDFVVRLLAVGYEPLGPAGCRWRTLSSISFQ